MTGKDLKKAEELTASDNRFLDMFKGKTKTTQEDIEKAMKKSKDYANAQPDEIKTAAERVLKKLRQVNSEYLSWFEMILAMVFAVIGYNLPVALLFFQAKMDGLRIEDVEPLLQLRQTGTPIGLRGLLVGGIIISALGAVMDVTMGIASSLAEVHAANPQLSRRELFRSGMNIGRDMVGTMTNTLILAFLGSGFTLILYLYSLRLSFRQLMSSAYVSMEVVSGIASSVGVILSIPLTALITAAVFTREKQQS